MIERRFYSRQLKALLKRNLLLKSREPIQTLFELIIPIVIFVLVSFAVTALQTDVEYSLPPNATLSYKPVTLDFNGTYYRKSPILLVVNTKVQKKRFLFFHAFKEILGGDAEIKLVSALPDKEKALISLKRAYLRRRRLAGDHTQDESALPIGVVVDLEQDFGKNANTQGMGLPGFDISKMTGIYRYSIFLSSTSLPDLGMGSFYERSTDRCLPPKIGAHLTEVDTDDISKSKCSALYYPRTGFLHIQNAIEKAVLEIEGDIPRNTTSDKLKWQFMPRTVKADAVANLYKDTFSSSISLLIVFLSAMGVMHLFVALVSGGVTEKEKGFRETMLLMGMNNFIWKLSWFIVYFVEMLLIAGVSSVIVYFQKLVEGTNVGMFFILLVCYGFALVSFGLLLITFFSSARAATTFTSFGFAGLGLPYMVVHFLKLFKPKLIPQVGLYLLAFLFPFGFQNGVALLVESHTDGVDNDIMIWGMVLMLLLDGCLYLLFGLLVDYLPGIIADSRNSNQQATISLGNGIAKSDTRDIESDPSLENQQAIVINNLTKTFISGPIGQREVVKAVDDLSLTIYGGQITGLLGHNGAGKTTLFRIMTGSLKDYQGDVSIFNWHVRSSRDMEELRRDIGVCAQQNTLFDNLTCAEHLNFVVELKCDAPICSRRSIVQETMSMLSLTDRANTAASNLSGGEKRKLCLAMSLISKPRLLFLDEPTAGVDVYCRRQIWDVLSEYKRSDRVIIITTHYMDEADRLTDRKAMLHKGRLYSAGSSMFLRQRFGCGYRLTVELDSGHGSRSIEGIKREIRNVMPNIEQIESNRSGNELVFALPTNEDENSGKLQDLLTFLESDQDKLAEYGVLCYGWSIANLDEVFLKLEEEVDVAEQSAKENGSTSNKRSSLLHFLRKRNGVNSDEFSEPSETVNANGGNTPLISFSGIDVPDSPSDEFHRHFLAILYLRAMQSLRSFRIIMMRFLFPIVLALVGLLFSKLLVAELDIKKMESSEADVAQSSLFIYQPFLYTNMSSSISSMLRDAMEDNFGADKDSKLVEKISDFTGQNGPFLLLKNFTDNSNSSRFYGDFLDMYTNTFLATPEGSDDFTKVPLIDLIEKYGSKIGAYYELNESGVVDRKVLQSYSAIHAMPSLLSYVHTMEAARNNFIAMFLPFLQSFDSAEQKDVFRAFFSNIFFTLLFALHVLPIIPSLGFDVVRDRETGCAVQVHLAGISKIAYWLGSFFVEYLEYTMFLLVFMALALAFNVYSLSFNGAICSYLIFVLLVAPANVLMVYTLATFIRTFRIFTTVVTFTSSITGLFPFMALFFWSMAIVMPSDTGFSVPPSNLRYDSNFQTVVFFFSFLSPPFNAASGMFLIALISQPNIATRELPTPVTEVYFNDPILPITWTASFVHIILFGTIILVHENWIFISKQLKISGGLFKLLRKNAYLKSKAFASGHGMNFGMAERKRSGEDDDVVAERRQVLEVMTSPVQTGDHLAPYVSEVRKVYSSLCLNCKPVEPKVAVEDVSFKLNYGQVFGLLGPNGAGKTTLIKMLIGSESLSHGYILSQKTSSLGYCPQENVLWDQLSGAEHIFIYSYARGFNKPQRAELVKRMGRGLGISEHISKQTRRMSGGTKRKMNVALSLMGRPSVLCLDEPSAGMDPGSKRYLWRVIKQIFAAQNDEWKIAALLTTHHLDEAEALCHRIAIMVNGVLRCIGSRQHLKSKYGKYYTLEVKVGDDQLMADAGATGLIEFVNKLIPASGSTDNESPQLINNFGRHFVFRVPSCRVFSLAKIFKDLEMAKRQGSFSSYSFSQVTLEQIFIQFAKEQYEDPDAIN